MGEDVHISLPPSAYIMKVKLPRLKEEPKADSADSADSGDSGDSDSKSEETETQPTEEVEDDDTIDAEPQKISLLRHTNFLRITVQMGHMGHMGMLE